MIILSTIDEAIQHIERTDRPAHGCELCGEQLADNVFTYEFEDGEVLMAELCTGCVLKEENDSLLAVRVLGAMIDRNETQIQVLEWLING